MKNIFLVRNRETSSMRVQSSEVGYYLIINELSHNVRKPTFWYVCPKTCAYAQSMTCAYAQFHLSLLAAWRNFVSLAIQNPPSEDSYQVAWMRRLTWNFAGHTSCPNIAAHLVLLEFSLQWINPVKRTKLILWLKANTFLQLELFLTKKKKQQKKKKTSLPSCYSHIESLPILIVHQYCFIFL